MVVNPGNSIAPVQVVVPGTTGDQGLASVVLISGSDTSSVGVSILQSSANPQVQCWLGSVSMPTNTAGLNNTRLPNDGSAQPFGKYDRYYAVPPSSWNALTISSKSNTPFISIQFRQSYATIYIVNPTQNASARVQTVGSVTEKDYEIVKASQPPQSISTNIQGDGMQWVWMNVDSMQDSSAATISLQALALK